MQDDVQTIIDLSDIMRGTGRTTNMLGILERDPKAIIVVPTEAMAQVSRETKREGVPLVPTNQTHRVVSLSRLMDRLRGRNPPCIPYYDHTVVELLARKVMSFASKMKTAERSASHNWKLCVQARGERDEALSKARLAAQDSERQKMRIAFLEEELRKARGEATETMVTWNG